MKRNFLLLIGSIALLVVSLTSLASPALQAGALIAVGGGGTPESVVARAIELAGGAEAVVAVLPHASERSGHGVGSAEMFSAAGAGEAFVLEDLNHAATLAKLERATLVWMPGGSQNRLMDAIKAAELGDTLRAMHARGVCFGGTSAGAAVQSRLMITGTAELESILVEGTQLAAGMGLWSEVIVDQHALKRRRLQRLLSAVLDHPQSVGVAIDEGTAVVVQGSRFEVMGSSSVLVIDARKATVGEGEQGELHSARNLSVHLLCEGQVFELALEQDD